MKWCVYDIDRMYALVCDKEYKWKWSSQSWSNLSSYKDGQKKFWSSNRILIWFVYLWLQEGQVSLLCLHHE